MLLNRSHVAWAWFTLLATLVSIALYVLVFHPEAVPFRVNLPEAIAPRVRLHSSVGNSPLGLAYGIIAYAIFIFAVLLNARRKLPLLRVGRAQSWLRAHIWLTILTLPLVFMHAAFRFGGMMTSTLMWLYLIVMISGFYGLGLQQVMPRLIKMRITLESIYEEIPYLTQQLLVAALKMRDELRAPAVGEAVGVAGVGAAVISPGSSGTPAAVLLEAAPGDASVTALLEALEQTALPYLASRKAGRSRMNDPRFSTEFFRLLRLRTAASYHDNVDQVARWCEERRQMDLQMRYHHWLHGWLLVHVPSSFLLIILTGWHAVAEIFLY